MKPKYSSLFTSFVDIENFFKLYKVSRGDVLRNEVKNSVQSQVDCGIDVVSDGEMSKISYSTYIKDRLHGFSGDSELKAPADLDAFPSYKEKISKRRKGR